MFNIAACLKQSLKVLHVLSVTRGGYPMQESTGLQLTVDTSCTSGSLPLRTLSCSSYLVLDAQPVAAALLLAAPAVAAPACRRLRSLHVSNSMVNV
jgi:hypothetical protein